MANQVDYIFVKAYDKDLINAIYWILFRCGIKMAKQFLFHWIPPYSRRAIRRDCDSKSVVIVKDVALNAFTSTFQMKVTDKKGLYVGKIATDPKFEGQGIGKANLHFMELYAIEHGCNFIELDVYEKSLHALRFYEKNGFVTIGTRHSIRFRELTMQKKLG